MSYHELRVALAIGKPNPTSPAEPIVFGVRFTAPGVTWRYMFRRDPGRITRAIEKAREGDHAVVYLCGPCPNGADLGPVLIRPTNNRANNVTRFRGAVAALLVHYQKEIPTT